MCERERECVCMWERGERRNERKNDWPRLIRRCPNILATCCWRLKEHFCSVQFPTGQVMDSNSRSELAPAEDYNRLHQQQLQAFRKYRQEFCAECCNCFCCSCQWSCCCCCCCLHFSLVAKTLFCWLFRLRELRDLLSADKDKWMAARDLRCSNFHCLSFRPVLALVNSSRVLDNWH